MDYPAIGSDEQGQLYVVFIEMSLNGSFLERLPTLSKQEEDIFGYNFMYCLESMIQEIGTLLVGKLSTHSNGTSIRG